MLTMTATIVLACIGGGTAIKPDSSSVSGNQSGSYDYGRGQYSGSFSGTIDGTRQQDFADQVDVELNDSEGRIRLPRIMLPLLRGGERGWFDLRKVEYDGRSITASAAVNLINRPKIHIDRVTGTISITGMGGNYVGKCTAVDEDAEAKF